MNADNLLEGEYIKAVELGDKLPANPTYTIVAVNIETMGNLKKPGKDINKGVVSFREIERGWVMNRTNVECLKALFGPETDGWKGKRVTLGTEPTKTGPGIRVIGSPDIDREVVATWTPPRQRTVSKKLVPTGERKPQQPPPTVPVDKDLQAFRTAVIAATKRTENPWTNAQITFALNEGGAKTAADVPVDRRPAFLELIQGAPPVAPTSDPTTEEGAD